MPVKIKDKKWILYRHTNNLDIVKAVAVNLLTYSKSGISKEDKAALNQRLRELSYYAERNPELKLDAINHKINTLAYFMFGYKATIHGKQKFLFSPLGDLMLANFDNPTKSAKTFIAQLIAIQFPHPHGGTHEDFKLYPYRLLFKLLLDSRLHFKLSSLEIATCIVFVKSIDTESYEVLVNQILKLRAFTNQDWIEHLESKHHAHVNAYYEWDYYQSKLIASAGIIMRIEGEPFYKMEHGQGTIRTIKNTYITLNEDVFEFCSNMIQKYSPFKTPLELNDPHRLTSDIIKEIYSFFPPELLNEIGTKKDKGLESIVHLLQAIEYHSSNPEQNSPTEFEKLLTDGFNYFVNVDANLIGGAGKTDIECLYYDTNFVFCVDAKSSSKKLTSLNSNRLKYHRNKIGAGYTIVITPKYVPSVLVDIIDENIVIVLSSTFTEYLYKLVNANDVEVDYTEMHHLILNNPGIDISNKLSDLTFDQFAV